MRNQELRIKSQGERGGVKSIVCEGRDEGKGIESWSEGGG